MIPKQTASISRNRATAWLAWLLWALSVALALFGLLFLVLNGSFENLTEESVGVDAAVAVAFPGVGAIIASRRPGNAIGWLFCAIGFSQGAAVFAGQYATYALLTKPGSLPSEVAAFWLGSWVWLPGVALTLTFLLLLFPDGRLPSRRWRPVAWLSAVVTVLGVFLLAVAPWDLIEPVLPADNPFEVERIAPFVETIAIPLIVLAATCTLLCALSLILRFKRSREERQQVKWFLYAGALYLLTVLFPPSAISDLQILTAPLLPIAAGIAILRYRLYDIDLIINRTLVYAALTACVVGIYVLVVGYLGALFRTGGNLLVSVIATGVVAVLFQPLRERLQRGVDRVLYGERDDPYAVLSRLGRRLEATLAPEAVLPTIVETVKEALKLPYAAILLKTGDEITAVAASVGVPVAEPVRLPLLYRSEPVGELSLGPRVGEEDFSAADRRLLEDLARQAGVAAYAVRLTNDLQRSRERLVATREEERRRLRRDLHDGLGAQLAGLTVQTGVLRGLIKRDPEAADELVVELREELRSAIADIRRLIYDLRPPALDEMGLIGALRRLAERYGAEGASLRVSVAAPVALPPLPAAVEVAVYRIAQEALTNVVRHARARECVLRLTVANDKVSLEIVDDGTGLPEGRPAGVGLLAMRERAAELGGSCDVESAAGQGTRVLVWLPLPKE